MSNDILKDAYNKYRQLGFVLHKSAKHKKHAYREGAYIERENEEWEDSATGYVGIIPPNLIIVDNDAYNDEGKSFKKLLKDLDLDYIPEPFAITPSGGEHYAFNNPNEDMVIGNVSKIYESLDIYAGYQSVLPIVGTTVYNKQNELASYTWGTFDDEFIVNEYTPKMAEVFKMRVRAEGSNTEYEDDMGLSVAVKAGEMSDEEVVALLENVPPDVDYDTWLAIGMCLYDRYEGGDDGLKLFLDFSAKSLEKDDPSFTEKKWRNGNFKPTSTTYTRLRSISHEFELNNFEHEIKTADVKKIKKIIKKISDTPHLNTRGKLDQDVREDLSHKLNERFKELKKEDPTVKVLQARTLIKDIQHVPTVEQLEEKGGGANMEVFLDGKSFVLRVGKKVSVNLAESSIIRHCSASEIPPQVATAYINKASPISGVKVESDYLIESDISFETLDSGMEHEYPFLHIKSNPTVKMKITHEYDEEIINDFFNNIWQGTFEDIIKLVALTIRFKEGKKNQLMLVTPTSFGKTQAMKHMGFNEIGMSLLLGAMQNDGIGGEVLNPIKETGLMLINEVDTAIPKALKELENRIQVKEFGMGGGTRSIPLHFLIMTSTHRTAILKASDEVAERTMFMELKEFESKYRLTKSPIFKRDKEYYSNVLKSHTVRQFKHYLYDGEFTANDLYELQEKYNLETSEDLDGIIEDVFYTTREAIRSGLGVEKDGNWYVKRKTDVRDLINSLLQDYSGVDTGKYVELIADRLIEDKRVKVKGELLYRVNEKVNSVIDEFDDLDIDDL